MIDGMQRCLAIAIWAGTVLANVERAVAEPLATPYVTDEATLHLWHLDEPAPPFMDSGTNPTPLWGLLNGAQAGAPALDGFGATARFVHTAHSEPGVNRPYGPILLANDSLEITNQVLQLLNAKEQK